MFHLAAYNYWANARIIKSILEAGEEKADVEIISSFPSVRKTLYHIYDAENVWLLRTKGLPYTWPPSQDFNGNLKEFCDLLLKNSIDFKEYVEALTEKDFTREISYSNSKRVAFSTSVQDIITHCMNHSTYHRGQLVTMLRIVGHTKFEPLDYIGYVREKN